MRSASMMETAAGVLYAGRAVRVATTTIASRVVTAPSLPPCAIAADASAAATRADATSARIANHLPLLPNMLAVLSSETPLLRMASWPGLRRYVAGLAGGWEAP